MKKGFKPIVVIAHESVFGEKKAIIKSVCKDLRLCQKINTEIILEVGLPTEGGTIFHAIARKVRSLKSVIFSTKGRPIIPNKDRQIIIDLNRVNQLVIMPYY